jgi:ubiquinone/menaquinone biosynthesis C-methylase UbiE
MGEPLRFLGVPIRYGYTGIHKRLGAARRLLSWDGLDVLDLGCGNGAYTIEIARSARSVVGVDLDDAYLRELQPHMDGLSHLACALAVGERLPFADASFDCVFCIETLEHVDDERAALAEIRRVLRPGGALLLTIPNKWYPFETHGLRILPWGQYYPFASWLPRALHARWANARIYTPGDIRRLLAETGWQHVRLDWMLPPLDMLNPAWLRPPLRALLALLDRTPLRRFGVSLIVAAQPAQH